VADHEFEFSLELSERPYFDRMLTDVARTVLTYVGYQGSAIEELDAQLKHAITRGGSDARTRFDIRFRAHNGELRITVASAGAAEWHTTRPLP
jgi:hypothetical protein